MQRRISVVVQPYFWLFAALIGWLNSPSLSGTILWIGIILLSVLFHEFGHALTAVFFRQKAQIQLVALGGVTTFHGPKLKFWQQFIIVLNGPLAGILLFFLASLALALPLSSTLRGIVATIRTVNLFWSIINLLPVLPLDGGQLLRIALEGFFGVKGYKASLVIGIIFATLLSFYFFIAQAFLIGAFFFLFAFQTFDLYRKSRNANFMDREDSLKKMLLEAESLLQQGRPVEAEALFQEVLMKGAGGLLSSIAAQYIAFLYVQQGKRQEAYDLLLSNKERLDDSARCLLHQLAAEQGNHPLVAELSADCYQFSPKQEVALRNARAFAALNQPQPSGGWIQTAWQLGPFDLKTCLDDEVFNSVRNNSVFRHFVDPLYEGHRS